MKKIIFTVFALFFLLLNFFSYAQNDTASSNILVFSAPISKTRDFKDEDKKNNKTKTKKVKKTENKSVVGESQSINVSLVKDETPPSIEILSPQFEQGKATVKDKKVVIEGKVSDQSGIYEVLINGEDAYVSSDGTFKKEVLLAIGENNLTITAIDLKKNVAIQNLKVVREPNDDIIVTTNEPAKIEENGEYIYVGKYYALLIANNDYYDPSITSLDGPISDAQKLYDVLTQRYTFEPENVIFLKNATYSRIIDVFDSLSLVITDEDNLLIFYAGHGYWDGNFGYWLPVDAKHNSKAFWLRNSTISDYIAAIHSKHTLLIADACFSGSIFKTRKAFNAPMSIYKMYNLPSRKAITSGNLKEVPDKSMFLYYLVKRLNENNKKFLPADELFLSFRQAVMNYSDTEPLFGTIKNSGDEGGEFIFILRDK